MKFLPSNCVVAGCVGGRCCSYVMKTHRIYSCFYYFQFSRFGLEGHWGWKEVLKPNEPEVLRDLFSCNVDSI